MSNGFSKAISDQDLDPNIFLLLIFARLTNFVLSDVIPCSRAKLQV